MENCETAERAASSGSSVCFTVAKKIKGEMIMEYGLQLYSIRDLTKEDFEGALKRVAQIGYKMVEPAGFFGHSAEEVDAMMKKYGLKVSGTHTGWEAVLKDTEATIAYHKAIGCDNIIIPGANVYNRADIEEFIESLKTQ